MIISIKKAGFILSAIVLCLSACRGGGGDEPTPAGIPAFPGAEGGGKYVTGGREGVVIHVTTLEDARDEVTKQPAIGTLRKALQMDGTRTVVFDVAGTINLTSQLEITGGNLTVAGQTAPGDGICIAGYPVVVKASNVILRFLRFRMGDQNKVEGDALTICEHKNIIVDHCSFSWSTDECVSVYGNENFTLQYCFITESLKASVHAKGAHGYGGIWGGKNASFHHNLLAHHQSRNPRFDHDYVNSKCAGPIDFVNNVVYNWESNSAYGGEGSTQGAGGRHINYVNNYYKPGPSTKSGVKTRLVDPTTSCSNCVEGSKVLEKGGSVVPPKIYLVGNTMYGSSEVTADNWKGSTRSKSVAGVDTRWTDGLVALSQEQSAEAAYETVLAKAGCSLHRDALDTRIVNDVRNGSGKLVNSPDEAGGYPALDPGTALTDTDRDGMPDQWEDEKGLNKSASSDGKLYTLDKNYTNLEIYLNSLVADLY